MTRRVPPGCCPGCLQERVTEPCALHRTAADLLDACDDLLRLVTGDRDPARSRTDVVEFARLAIARAEGRGS